MRAITTLIIVLLLFATAGLVSGENAPAKPSISEIKKKIAAYIALDADQREELRAFFTALEPLGKSDEKKWRKEIREALSKSVTTRLQKQLGKDFGRFAKSGVFEIEGGGAKMKYYYRTTGKKEKTGSALYINLHGGGDSAAVNDSAWQNAKGQYSVMGSLIAPRSTQDVALSWAVPEMIELVDNLLFEAFLVRDIDPNRVYVLGYSMGGWGTLLLGPAMADRFAAVGSSAGGEHVSRASPDNLRNTPIIIQIGTEDHAFKRYELSKAYGDRLKELHEADKEGYIFEYREHKGAAHQISDSDTPKWLSQHTRNPYPAKIVWKPVAVTGWKMGRFYYIRLVNPAARASVVLTREGNTFTIVEGSGYDLLRIYVNDEFVDMAKPIVVMRDGKEVFNAVVSRSMAVLLDSYLERADERMTFSGVVEVQ